MTFWTSNTLSDPIKARNFRVRAGEDGPWWWAKSVTKPSVDFSENAYLLANTNFKFPGVATWNDVTITFVEVGGKVKSLYEGLFKNGYGIANKVKSGDGYTKSSIYTFIIETYSDKTKDPVEVWTLGNAFVKSIDFGGEMSYSSDELMAVSLVVSYDWAELEVDGKNVNDSPITVKPSAVPAVSPPTPSSTAEKRPGEAGNGTIGDCAEAKADGTAGFDKLSDPVTYNYKGTTYCIERTKFNEGPEAVAKFLDKQIENDSLNYTEVPTEFKEGDEAGQIKGGGSKERPPGMEFLDEEGNE